MRKLTFVILMIIPFKYVRANPFVSADTVAPKTLSGSVFGDAGSSYTISMSSASTESGSNNKGNVSNRTSEARIPAGIIIGNTYSEKAKKEYDKAITLWQTDMDKAIKCYYRAKIYDPAFTDVYNKALGLRELNNGDKEFDRENWDGAIEYYKKALAYFPDYSSGNYNSDLKSNIISASFNKISAQAIKCYYDKNWICAAAYYNVLMKNFDERGLVEERFSACYSELSKMDKDIYAYTKFDDLVKTIKNNLPFINDEW